MDDRELLELAAKAYWGDEIDDVCSVRWLDYDQCIGYTHGDNQDHNGTDVELRWDPLTDDGDALRLAVALNIDIDFQCPGVEAYRSRNHEESFDGVAMFCPHEDGADEYANTRRAITRAAAAIGASK